jgi:hypothetical protein
MQETFDLRLEVPMDFADRIRELGLRIPQQLGHISTEEATKNALVLPFISALGYNVFDPREVTPELTADVGTKKGEKVDYAVMRDGEPIMLFEVKCIGTNLDKCHASQLYRYFSVTSARFGVLTNGVAYRFFSDLDAPNRMDTKPFLEIDLSAPEDGQLVQLKKFSKSSFDLEAILETASDLKYTGEIKKVLAQEMIEPSEELVRLFSKRVYSGSFTKGVREQFGAITKRALQEFISDRVRDRLTSALNQETETRSAASPKAAEAEARAEEQEVLTTPEELEAFHIVRAILAETVDPRRVVLRDVRSYCGVLLDDNNRRPICRLHFNTSQKYLGLFDEAKNEHREPIGEAADIYRFAKQLKDTVARYDA